MHSDTHKSSDEWQKEVEIQLAKVSDDMRKIDENLTPGRIIDKAIFNKFHGDRLAMLEHLKNRPIGTAMLASGILALGQDEESRENMKYKMQVKKGEYSARYQIAKNKLADKVDHLKENISSHEKNIKIPHPHTEYKSHRIDNEEEFLTRDANITMNDEFREDSYSLHNEHHSKVEDLKNKSKENYRQAKESLASTIDEHPLSIAALGFSLGALSASGFPASERETQFAQETGADFFQKLSEDFDQALNKSVDLLRDRFIKDLGRI
ncbi:MAG: hypothetical protein CME62_00795 [Halobacteriovoraceae bacterium]|nr:hypothetical protein [Halobacteriovoraceae bacterium]|tara:strand:- start:980 stop:1777 length:798 start_codon:yes stop_codon:yes gene_type:complete